MSSLNTISIFIMLFMILKFSNANSNSDNYKQLGYMTPDQFKEQYKKTFDNLLSLNPSIRAPLLPITGSLLDTVGCILDDVSMFSCQFNFTFDVFFLLRECSAKHGLLNGLANIEKLIPKIGAPLVIPPVTTDRICGCLPSLPDLVLSVEEFAGEGVALVGDTVANAGDKVTGIGGKLPVLDDIVAGLGEVVSDVGGVVANAGERLIG